MGLFKMFISPERVRNARRELGLLQHELARFSKVSKSAICAFELGTKTSENVRKRIEAGFLKLKNESSWHQKVIEKHL